MTIGHTASTSPVGEEPQRHADIEAGHADNEGALDLLREWLADESGYDESVWTRLHDAIEAHRLSARRRFRD
ncbi:MAG: hypothetical protein AB1714_10130 [Acidobacteriota bacterium]